MERTSTNVKTLSVINRDVNTVDLKHDVMNVEQGVVIMDMIKQNAKSAEQDVVAMVIGDRYVVFAN